MQNPIEKGEAGRAALFCSRQPPLCITAPGWGLDCEERNISWLNGGLSIQWLFLLVQTESRRCLATAVTDRFESYSISRNGKAFPNEKLLVFFQPAHGSVGIDGTAYGQTIFVKGHLRVMLKITVPVFWLAGSECQHDGGHLLADISEVL